MHLCKNKSRTYSIEVRNILEWRHYKELFDFCQKNNHGPGVIFGIIAMYFKVPTKVPPCKKKCQFKQDKTLCKWRIDVTMCDRRTD